jgi:hypothetical protein
VFRVGTVDQAADNQTKRLGPTKLWASVSLTNGEHPAVLEIQERVLAKYGRKRTRAEAADPTHQHSRRTAYDTRDTWHKADRATELGHTSSEGRSETAGRSMACIATLGEIYTSHAEREQQEQRRTAVQQATENMQANRFEAHRPSSKTSMIRARLAD